MLGGSTGWATEHHGCISAAALDFSRGEPARPGQGTHGFVPLGTRPAGSPLDSGTFQGSFLLKVQ